MNKKANSCHLDILNGVNKLLLFSMRVITILLCIGLTNLYANLTNAQTKIDIHLTNGTFKDLFKTIEAKSDFIVFYEESIVQNGKGLSIDVKKMTIPQILDMAFNNTDLDYAILDRQIAIKRKKEVPINTKTISLPQFEVSGMVIDNDGNPLPGANIVEKKYNKWGNR